MIRQRRTMGRKAMKLTSLTAIAFSSCAVFAADADEHSADHVASGVWYGTYPIDLAGGGRGTPVLYVLDLRVTDAEVVGTLAIGSGVDRRTAGERAMASLGLPGKNAPKAPVPLPIVGTVDEDELDLTTRKLTGLRQTVVAKVDADRMRAQVGTRQATRMVRLRRCEPSGGNAGDDCSLDALWAQYLKLSNRKTSSPPSPSEFRALVPPLNPNP